MQDDWRPTRRLIRKADGTPSVTRSGQGAYAFIHPCWICGDPNAGYGFGVDLSRGITGKWACRTHRYEVERAMFTRDEAGAWSVTEPQTSSDVSESPKSPDATDLF